MAEHTTYDDWWKERSVFERLDEIKVPTLSIGHWGKMGLHLRGNILGYEKIDAPKKLVVTGARDVFEAHDLFEQIDYHEAELLPFYDYYLKGEGADPMLAPPVKLYIRGDERFRDEKEWPPARAQYKSLYLSGGAVRVAHLAQRRQPVLGQAGRGRRADRLQLSRSALEAGHGHDGSAGPRSDRARADLHQRALRRGCRDHRPGGARALSLLNAKRHRRVRAHRRSGAAIGRGSQQGPAAQIGQHQQGLAARLASSEGRGAVDAAAAVLQPRHAGSRSRRARSCGSTSR